MWQSNPALIPCQHSAARSASIMAAHLLFIAITTWNSPTQDILDLLMSLSLVKESFEILIV